MARPPLFLLPHHQALLAGAGGLSRGVGGGREVAIAAKADSRERALHQSVRLPPRPLIRFLKLVVPSLRPLSLALPPVRERAASRAPALR